MLVIVALPAQGPTDLIPDLDFTKYEQKDHTTKTNYEMIQMYLFTGTFFSVLVQGFCADTHRLINSKCWWVVLVIVGLPAEGPTDQPSKSLTHHAHPSITCRSVKKGLCADPNRLE